MNIIIIILVYSIILFNINDKLSNGVGGKIFLPSGTYLFSGTINFSTIGSGSQPIEFIGQGRTTKFLWSSDDDLFVFGGNNQCCSSYF